MDTRGPRQVADAVGDASRALCATVIAFGQIPPAAASMRPDDLPVASHQEVWRLFVELASRGQEITPHALATLAAQLGVTGRLPEGGQAGWCERMAGEHAVPPARLKQIVSIISADVGRRQIARAAVEAQSRAERGAPLVEIVEDLGRAAERVRATVAPGEPDTICLATVAPRTAEWLWQGRLAVGEMTVLTGAPGVGKGLLLCYIVACFTKGRPMHGDRTAQPAGDVLWIAVEDAHDAALVPRLVAARADRSRVHAWDMDRPLSLPGDTDRVMAEVVRHRCGMVIIDPAPTLLGREHSSNNDADVRRSFSPLATACRDRRCALVLVRHTNKRTLGSAMDRGGGSIGWTGMARIELMLGRRPLEDRTTEPDVADSVITLAHVKNNLGKWPRSLNLRIVEVGESARVDVIGETDSTADDLCGQDLPRPARKAGDAETLIRRVLADGEWHPQREIEAAAKASGISTRTLQRAKADLNVKSRQLARVWSWCLPRQTAMTGMRGDLAAWRPETPGDLTPDDINRLESSDGQAATPPDAHSDGHLTPDGHGYEARGGRPSSWATAPLLDASKAPDAATEADALPPVLRREAGTATVADYSFSTHSTPKTEKAPR